MDSSFCLTLQSLPSIKGDLPVFKEEWMVGAQVSLAARIGIFHGISLV